MIVKRIDDQTRQMVTGEGDRVILTRRHRGAPWSVQSAWSRFGFQLRDTAPVCAAALYAANGRHR